MSLDIGKERLEQRKLYIMQSIEAMEEHAKQMQQKQVILQKRLECLKFRKKILTRMINHHTESRYPYLQIVNVDKKIELEITLYLN
jgi:hypothetical protein